MEEIIYFTSYNQGIIPLTPSGISKAMYKEASRPGVYDYKDPTTGLSFQLVSTTRAFVCDPDCPVVSQILAAQWQIIYDAAFSGVGKLKFVAKGLDNTVSTNWKNINDVLQSYNWTGTLPITQLSQVYMGVFDISTSLYVVGTLFAPSQPYLRLKFTGSTAQTIAANTTARIAFDAIDEQAGAEEADSAQLVPVLTGPNSGVVRISSAGLYLVHATVGLTTTTTNTLLKLIVRLNGITKTITSNLLPVAGTTETDVSTTIRVTRADLSDITFADQAKLEVFVTNNGTTATVASAEEITSVTVTFLG